MRVLILAILLMVAQTCAGQIQAARAETPFQAGVVHVTVQDAEPFDTMVWYPTRDAEVPYAAGPYTVTATRDATLAEGERFPVILLSHGHRGTPLGHRDLAAFLARDGFIVVVPTHIGDSATPAPPRSQRQVLTDRPRQARLALDRVLSDPRFAPGADTARIGAIGFSAGGYTVLALAGARPNFAQAMVYCREHPADRGSCGPVATGGDDPPAAAADMPPMSDPRIKAVVVLDPLAFVFDRQGLAAVRMPILLLRPESDDYLSSAGNALALAAGLPTAPRQIVVPGSHFVFLDPCPPALAASAPGLCKDAPGVDRVAVHRQFEKDIAAFLHQSLRGAASRLP